MSPIYTVVDLFSGCGGLTAGFVRANSDVGEFRPVAAVDSDADSAATYAKNLGGHVFLGTIEDWLEGAHYPDAADVVLGGLPCQGFSPLGKQMATDQRNALWEQFSEAVAAMWPKFFILENVPEFLKSEQFRRMEAACKAAGRLEDYEMEHFVLDSSLYGAPQKRRRAIVIGRRRGSPPLGKPPESVSRSNVREAFEGLKSEVHDRYLPNRITDFQGYRVPGPFIGQELHITRSFTRLSMQRYRSIPARRQQIQHPLSPPCAVLADASDRVR